MPLKFEQVLPLHGPLPSPPAKLLGAACERPNGPCLSLHPVLEVDASF